MKKKSRERLWKKIALLGKVLQNPSARKLLQEYMNREFARAVIASSNKNTSPTASTVERKKEKNSSKTRSLKDD